MAKIENYKEELINRYKYLYENITYILAPCMYEETEEDVKKRIKKLCCSKEELTLKRLIYRKGLDIDILSMLEEFLLDDIPFKDTIFYNYLEEQKQNPEYLKKVSYGLSLFEKYDARIPKNSYHRIKKNDLTLWNLLENVRMYIDAQIGYSKDKVNKLQVLDEYFRLNRYKNDGSIWSSGYHLSTVDFINNCVGDSYSTSSNSNIKIKDRKPKDVGVKKNSFIDYFISTHKDVKTGGWLTEKEKQEVYLRYHEELPHDLYDMCCDNNLEVNSFIPKETFPCFTPVLLKEENIFFYEDKFYHVCPTCGYIILIVDMDEYLTEGIKKRIIERSKKDLELPERMILYSKLKHMEDKLPDEGYIKVLKKKK